MPLIIFGYRDFIHVINEYMYLKNVSKFISYKDENFEYANKILYVNYPQKTIK